MKTTLHEAIANNIGLYQAILSAQAITLQLTDKVVYTEDKVPPYYSNLVTHSPHWQPRPLLQQVDGNAVAQRWPSWSIKDSFDVLNLSAYGFAKLFDAYWFHWPMDHLLAQATFPIHYELIQSEPALTEWRQAWDADVALGNAIFPPALLSNPQLCFVGGYVNGQLVTGCLINQTDHHLLGVSNFFAPDSSATYWLSLIHFVHERLGQKAIVGYQQEAVVSQLTRLGLEPLGKLSVWLNQR